MKPYALFIIFALLWAPCLQAAPIPAFYTAPDGIRIYYEHYPAAQPKAPVVFLVHGFTVGGDSWKALPLFEALQQAGFSLVVMDLIGNGRSDKPYQAKFYQQDREAADIMGIASELGLKKYHLVSYSRGAIIATRVLVLDKRVQKAVLGGMGLDFTNPQWPRRLLFFKALQGEHPVPELSGFLAYVERKGLDKALLARQQEFQPSTPLAALKRIKQPLLVIAGNKDTDNGQGQELANHLPHARWVEVPGDHSSAPKTSEFTAAIVDFLRGH